MTIDTMSLLFGLYAVPVWAPADEGTGGGNTDEGANEDEGNGKTNDEGRKDHTEGTVLGGDDETSETTDDDAANSETGDGDGDEKSGDDDEGDEDPTLNEVPEDGEYKALAELPEGFTIEDSEREFWAKEFADRKLTNGEAQRAVELAMADRQRQAEEAVKFIEKRQEEHLTAAKKDKEIGGDKWDQSVKLANLGLQALRGGPKGDPDAKNADGSSKGFKAPGALEKLILETGNGNNPDIVRELRRIGTKFADDTFDPGKGKDDDVPTEKSWYGDTTPETKKG